MRHGVLGLRLRHHVRRLGPGSGLAEGNDFFGTSGWFLTGDAYDVTTIEVWMFQMVFAATAATIVSGTMAERTKINAYMAYSFLISAIIYPVYGHWVWGGGWLATMSTPAVDFAGSGVVHTVGGTAALVGGLMLGPRIGKFGPDGKARLHPRPQHDAGGARHVDPVPRLVRI